MQAFGCASLEGIRQMPHTSPDERIDDLCLQIQSERDGHKLLQLIDQLYDLLDVKERLLAKMVRLKKPSVRSQETA